MFFPMKETGIKINACEDSRFFDLFPLGFIVSAIVLTKQKKKGEKTDLLLKILIVISIILGYFCIFGVPEIISKITLLKFSTANRAYLAFVSSLNRFPGAEGTTYLLEGSLRIMSPTFLN